MTLATALPRTEVAYFCVGTTKLVLMTLTTFTVYSVYWFYRNWKAEQAISRNIFSPLFRAIFIVIFFYAFAARVKDRGLSANVPVPYSPVLLTAVFLLFFLCSRLPDPFWMISLAGVVPMLPIQKALQRINVANGIGQGRGARFSTLNIIWIVFGSLLLLMALIGSLLPADV